MKSVRWVVALLVMMLVVVAFALAIRGGDHDATAASPTVTPGAQRITQQPAPTPTAAAREVPGMLTLADTSDPDAYAESVAALVFSMDPRAFEPEDYRAVLLGEADPLMDNAGMGDLERTVQDS